MKNASRRTYYVLAIIAFIVINYLLSFMSFRLDFSKGKAYSLSDSTRSLLRNLKEPVSITFFSSSVLPSKLQPIKRDVTDLLSEYKKAGGGKITIATKDPKKDDAAKKEADTYGIPELNFSQQERDQFAVTTGYFGMGITQKTKKAVIPQVANIQDLEYNLTSSIYKVSNVSLPAVGIIGGDNPGTQMNVFRQAAASQFSLSDSASPAANMKAVLVMDSRTKTYSADEIAALEKYIRNGGKAIFMTDGVWVANDLVTAKAAHGLFPLFKRFGINLNEDLILSTAAEIVNFGGGQGSFQILTAYPYWLRTQTFNTSSSYFSNLRQISFPWVSSVSLSNARDTKLAWLVRTTKNSWEQTKDFTIVPNALKQPNPKDFRQFNLIASAKLQNGGQLMVIPSSRFLDDQFVPRGADNLEYIMNVLSDYAAGGALSGIRQRTVDLYPLPPDMSNQQKDMFKYLTILLLPGLFAAYGVYNLAKRK